MRGDEMESQRIVHPEFEKMIWVVTCSESADSDGDNKNERRSWGCKRSQLET